MPEISSLCDVLHFSVGTQLLGTYPSILYLTIPDFLFFVKSFIKAAFSLNLVIDVFLIQCSNIEILLQKIIDTYQKYRVYIQTYKAMRQC